MTTARDIVEAALRKIHVLGRGQRLNASEGQAALDGLNYMFSSWVADGGYVPFVDQETFTLDGSGTYTYGVGGDFDSAEPLSINSVFVSSGGLDYNVRSVGLKEYNSIALKNTGAIPCVYYFEYGFPLSKIHVYPTSESNYTITINSNKRVSTIPNLSTVLGTPPEYDRAFIYNLAVDLAPDYEKEASMSVQREAKKSKRIIFEANTRNTERVSMSALGGRNYRYNINEGNYT